MTKARYFVFSVLVGLAVTCGAVSAKQEHAAKPPSGTGKAADQKEPVNKPPRVVMLRINGEEITVEDYVNFLQRNPVYLESSALDAGKAAAVQAMVANQLLRDDVLRKGLVASAKKPTVAELREGYEKLAAQKFPAPPAPGDDAAYQFYQAHQNDYGIPEMVRVSQIQFRNPENATAEQKVAVKKRAEDALRRLNAGESFAKLAGELTENPRAKPPQGDLGFLGRMGDPWLTAAIQNLKVGEHTQVIESPAGYEILMLADVRPALISPYPNVRDKVIQRMRAEAQAKLRDAYVKDLAKNAKVELVQEDLKPLFPKGIFP